MGLEAVRQALRLLWAHKLRASLTLFGLVWGTASVIFLVGWGRGVTAMLERGFFKAGKNLGEVWAGRVSEEYRLSRPKFRRFMAQREPGLVLLEACGTAHYWGRELRQLGHTALLQMGANERGSESAKDKKKVANTRVGQALDIAKSDHPSDKQKQDPNQTRNCVCHRANPGATLAAQERAPEACRHPVCEQCDAKAEDQ